MRQTSLQERDKTLDELYAQIKTKGWVVDVRSVRPTLIKSGTAWARTFETPEAAIMYALREIRAGR